MYHWNDEIPLFRDALNCTLSLLSRLQAFAKTESQREGYIQLALQAYAEAMATSTPS